MNMEKNRSNLWLNKAWIDKIGRCINQQQKSIINFKKIRVEIKRFIENNLK